MIIFNFIIMVIQKCALEIFLFKECKFTSYLVGKAVELDDMSPFFKVLNITSYGILFYMLYRDPLYMALGYSSGRLIVNIMKYIFYKVYPEEK